ncbi:hypothetical protein G9274_002725 [Stenotrophomonas rhizophila]|nr:hypothetical protein G9274_002725 [Stenotrophomonas rhizophila]
MWLSLAAWSLTGGPWSVQLHLQDEHPDICVQTGGQTPQCVSTLLRHLAVALPRWA